MAKHVGDLMNGAIPLESDRATDEHVTSFWGIWDAALSRIPADYLRVIEGYWRGRVAPETCRHKPNVKPEYKPHVTLYDEARDGGKGVSKTLLDGHVLTFPVRLLEQMGREFAVLSVAHELAHVTFYAEAEPNHWPDSRDDAAYVAAEGLVDARLVGWGFDQTMIVALDAWMLECGYQRY
jgi:hypothetical protein